jgi:hypothetical protein
MNQGADGISSRAGFVVGQPKDFFTRPVAGSRTTRAWFGGCADTMRRHGRLGRGLAASGSARKDRGPERMRLSALQSRTFWASDFTDP